MVRGGNFLNTPQDKAFSVSLSASCMCLTDLNLAAFVIFLIHSVH